MSRRASVVELAHAVRSSRFVGVGRRISRRELAFARSRSEAIATLLLVRWLLDDTGRGEEAFDRLLLNLSRAGWKPHPLTYREWEVLAAAAAGLTRRATGELLGIDEETVKTHRRHAQERLAAENTTHAVAEAIRRGLL